jgi:serine/threonine-protein kinase
MGSVWLADHLTLDMRCAVKFLSDEAVGDPRYRAQFHIEARATAQAQGPHVVRVLDHDVCDDWPYIAMELLVGEDLCTRLQRVGRLDARATYQIVSQVARGLSKVHAAGIVHHDLKPENIFLTQELDEEVVKLLDFGIAKVTAFSLLESLAAQTGGLVGTPQYMSPEQACGVRDIDHRSDVWSLAVIAYECLSGELPFEGSTQAELLGRITCGPLPVPSEVAPDLSPDFDRWWARAALRNIDGRFQSARDLADALGQALRVTEASATEDRSPRASLTSAPRIDSSTSDAPPPEPAAVRPVGSRTRGKPKGKLLAAAGLIIALIALPARGGRTDARMGDANTAAPRAASIAAPPFDSAPTVRPHATGSVGPVSEPPGASSDRVTPAEPPLLRIAAGGAMAP